MKLSTRLDHLETWVKEHTQDELTVLYEVNGQEKRGSVADMLKDEGYFIKVLDGGSLKDLDLLLESIAKQSMNQDQEEGK